MTRLKEGWGNFRPRGGFLLHPYFALHIVCMVSYFVLRFFALPSVSPQSKPHFLRWESQAGLSLIVILVVKFVRANTWEGYIGDALLYAKCMLALQLAILDPRMLAWYLFILAAGFLLWNQPAHTGPENVLALTPLQLESYLLENRSSALLVEFGAAWSPRCNHFKRIFAELSLEYSTAAVHFGRVDVGRFPSVASKYGIEFGVYQRQLPTLVLFEGGVELSRFPQLTYDGMSFPPAFTKSMVIHNFELDLLLLRGLSRKAGTVRGESLAK